MRRLLAFLLFSTTAFAQSTTVSTTGVVDSNGTTWANGSYRIDFQTDPYHTPPQYTWSGGPFSLTHQGSLDTNGAFSISLPSNDAITPAGSKWKVTVCPNAAGSCYGSTFPVIGPTMDITSALNQAVKPPSFPSTPQQWGYADSELLIPPSPGATYYNTTTGVTRCWTGSTWTTCSGAGGGLPTATAAGQAPVSTGAGTTYTAQPITLLTTTNTQSFTPNQMNIFQSINSGVNFQTEIQDLHGGSFWSSEEVAVGLNVPGSSTQSESHTLAAYTTCGNTPTYCVGGYFQSRITATGGNAYGLNINVMDNGLAATGGLYGFESDAQVASASTIGQAVRIVVNTPAGGVSGFDDVDILAGSGGALGNGLYVNTNATNAVNITDTYTESTALNINVTNTTNAINVSTGNNPSALLTSTTNTSPGSVAQFYAPNVTGTNSTVFMQIGKSSSAGNSLYQGFLTNTGAGISYGLFGVAGSYPSIDYFANQGVWVGGSSSGYVTTAAPANGLAVGTSQQMTVDGSGNVTAPSATIGASGTSLARYARYAVSLTPAAVAANTCAAQSFTVTGIAAADILIAVSKPTEQAGLSETPGHVSASNTATINFCNNTGSPITPTAAQTYQFVVVQ